MQLAYSASLAIIASSIFSLIWVWFWMRKQNVENGAALMIFFGGIISVPLAVLFQNITNIFTLGDPLITLLWVSIEEILKLSVVLFATRFFKFDKAKIVIYMILVAIGFAFMENILYATLQSVNNLGSLLINLQRFTGATFLHIVSSGLIGIALLFSLYKSPKIRASVAILALIVAITLHFFNNLIMGSPDIVADFGIGLFYIILWVLTLILVCIIYRKENIKTLVGQVSVFVLIIALFLSGIAYIQPKSPKYSPETISGWQVALKNVEESRAGFTDGNSQLVESISTLDSILLQLRSVISAMEDNKALSNEEEKFIENYDAHVDEYNCVLRKEEKGDSTEGCAL